MRPAAPYPPAGLPALHPAGGMAPAGEAKRGETLDCAGIEKFFLDKKVFCACKENYEERRNPIAGKFSRGQVEKYRG